MRRFTSSLPLLTLFFAGACADVDLGDAPDRGELLETDDVTFRPFGSGGVGGGSTQLNTGKLFQQGLPIRYFNRVGFQTEYDDPINTQVTFQSLKLRTGKGGALVNYPATTNSIRIEQGLLTLNGVAFPAGKLLGSEWIFNVRSATSEPRVVAVRITGVATATVPGDVQVPLYNFSLDGADAFYEGGPYSVCQVTDTITEQNVVYSIAENIPLNTVNTFHVKYSAALYGDLRVTETGVVVADDSSIYLACTSGAIGKSALWGYAPWSQPYQGLSGVQQLQAASRAIRADFCGDGVSNTQDGTPIQIRDRFWSSFDDPTEATESVWGDNGSQCRVTHDRLGSGTNYGCGGALTTSCNQLGSDWILGSTDFMWTKAGPDMTVIPPQNACNTTDWTPGCADPGIEAVVCSVDPYCCNFAWDSICVDEVTSLNAASEACCADNGGPGCGDASVTSCVAGYDAYCGQSRWDSLCALEVEHLGCGVCR